MTVHTAYPIILTLALALGGTACKKENSAPADKNTHQPAPKKADDGHNHAKSDPNRANPDELSVHFAFPQDGSTVPETFDIGFAVKGFKVTPAGKHVEDKSRGHHHIIVDAGPIPEGKAVPADDTHIHFGKGQTTTTLSLKPGPHKLTMQFADGAHISYGPKAAKTIGVMVVPSPMAAKVSFLEPKDGAKVKSPVHIKFGLEGMKIRPAGEDTLDKTSGHHHLIIDDKPPELGLMVPADETHIHYGKGQTETDVKLTPGKHRLTMQLADGGHLSYGPRLSKTINIEVVE